MLSSLSIVDNPGFVLWTEEKIKQKIAMSNATILKDKQPVNFTEENTNSGVKCNMNKWEEIKKY